jgi:hypothetical protein
MMPYPEFVALVQKMRAAQKLAAISRTFYAPHEKAVTLHYENRVDEALALFDAQQQEEDASDAAQPPEVA